MSLMWPQRRAHQGAAPAVRPVRGARGGHTGRAWRTCEEQRGQQRAQRRRHAACQKSKQPTSAATRNPKIKNRPRNRAGRGARGQMAAARREGGLGRCNRLTARRCTRPGRLPAAAARRSSQRPVFAAVAPEIFGFEILVQILDIQGSGHLRVSSRLRGCGGPANRHTDHYYGAPGAAGPPGRPGSAPAPRQSGMTLTLVVSRFVRWNFPLPQRQHAKRPSPRLPAPRPLWPPLDHADGQSSPWACHHAVFSPFFRRCRRFPPFLALMFFRFFVLRPPKEREGEAGNRSFPSQWVMASAVLARRAARVPAGVRALTIQPAPASVSIRGGAACAGGATGRGNNV
mgnify:CR=1 FL=1